MPKLTNIIPLSVLSGSVAVAALLAMTAPASADFASSTLERIHVRNSQGVAATTINESVSTLPIVPGTSIGVFTVAVGDTDVFTVLFTGQAELRNASSVPGTLNADDVLEVQMEALTNTGGTILLTPSGPKAFASGNSPSSHAQSWSAALITGTYTFRLRARVRDVAPAGTVSALLSHWQITIMRFD